MKTLFNSSVLTQRDLFEKTFPNLIAKGGTLTVDDSVGKYESDKHYMLSSWSRIRFKSTPLFIQRAHLDLKKSLNSIKTHIFSG